MASDSGVNPLGVCAFGEPPRNTPRTASYPTYVHEILAHAGVCYSSLSAEDLPSHLPGLRLLLTVGEPRGPDDLAAPLRAWVEAGGAWVSVTGVCGAADLFGVEVESPAWASWGGGLGTLGEGHLNAAGGSHPVLAHLSIPLHYFNGVPVRAAGGRVLAGILDAHGRPSSRAAVVEASVGKGRCLLIAPDVIGAVVSIQQGIAITRDGVPAADGTAPLCDGVLKSDDGAVLDWLLDREPVPGAPALSAFLQPVADQWRELLLRSLFYLASEQRISLPVLWLYPRDLPALAELSHDTDGNEPSAAHRLLQVLGDAGINSTWCVLAPGYPRDLIASIRQAGHELAMHYDAVPPGAAWSEDAFDDQWRQILDLFDGARPVTNKNHYLRWEGDTEFFRWCARRGIQLDQSKGVSKTGAVGFNFGTCHPYFPIDADGTVLDVLELPTPTQDLVVFAPEDLVDPLLAAVVTHHGVLHLLFHPAHIEKPGVADALLDAVSRAREHGLEWWRARDINAWERARRKARWTDYARADDGFSVRLQVADPLPEASIMWLGKSALSIEVNGEPCAPRTVERWGFPFQSVTLDLERDRDYHVQVTGPAR